MSLSLEGIESLFEYTPTPHGPSLEFVTVAGGVKRTNDPEVFAATLEALVAPFVRVEVEILDRRYILTGVTRNGDMVLRRVDT